MMGSINARKAITNSVRITQDALDKTCKQTRNPNGTVRGWEFAITDQWLLRMQEIRNRLVRIGY